MHTVYRASSLVEAQLVADRLEQEGIATYLRNVALQGALGELPLSLNPEVCVVDDSRVHEALAVVRQFERDQRAEPGPPRACHVCDEHSPANFEVCWKCRSPFDSA